MIAIELTTEKEPAKVVELTPKEVAEGMYNLTKYREYLISRLSDLSTFCYNNKANSVIYYLDDFKPIREIAESCCGIIRRFRNGKEDILDVESHSNLEKNLNTLEGLTEVEDKVLVRYQSVIEEVANYLTYFYLIRTRLGL